MVNNRNSLTAPDRSFQRGSSIIEVLVAMAILTLGISAVMMLVFGNQTLKGDAQANNEALAKAESLLEDARASLRQDFSRDAHVAQTTDGIYTKSLDVQSSDTFTKNLTSTVTWKADGGRDQKIELKTVVTDWKGAANICTPSLSGDWKDPQHYDFSSSDLIFPASGNRSNGLGISDVKAYRQKLYVTAISTDNFKNTFYIFDLPANPNHIPVYRGSIDNAPSTDDGLNAVTVDGQYAYVANSHDANFQTCTENASCAQLQIFDVGDPANPIVKKNYKLPSISSPFVLGNITGSNDQGVGKSISYKNGYIYLGLTTTSNGPGFHILDVHNPLSPQWVGSWPPPSASFGSSGAPINAIYVKDGYAYLAHPTGLVGAPNEQLTVLDVSSRASPRRVSGFFYNGGVGGNGKSVSKAGSNLYLGRTASKISGANDSIPEFFILDAADPANISSTPLGSLPLPTVADSINGLSIRDYLAFFITNTQFQIWNISDPTSIAPYAALPFSDFTNGAGTGTGTALNCSGNYFYIALTSPQGNNKDIVSIIAPYVSAAYTLGNSGDISVEQGSSGSNTITRTIVFGFPAAETLNVSGLPPGATVASFTNNPCAPNCSGILTIAATALMAPGTYPISVSAPSGVRTTLQLIVNPGPFDYSLSNSGDVSVKQGTSSTVTITSALVSGLTRPVTLSVSSVPALPASVAVNFDNNPCSPGCSNKVKISPSPVPATKNRSYQLTITGTPASDFGSRTTTFTLTVKP